MRIVVAGAGGFIGSALVGALRQRGDDVVVLVRRAARTAAEVAWDPDGGRLDPVALVGADAVVCLSGVNPGSRPLTTARKRLVRSSRVRTTSLLATSIAALDDGPRVFLHASGIGAYGDRGDEPLDETEPLGSTFFAGVVRDWEAAAAPARDAGTRVVHLRTGIVLSSRGGALGRLLPLVRAGLGGRLGPGDQYWSWITRQDEVAAIVHLLGADVHGPVNLVTHADRNVDVVGALARAYHRPARVPAPAWALRAVLGDFSSEVLGSVRAIPAALEASGFVPTHRDLATAAAWVAAGG